ncbi:MAG: 50S ribosomal protein L6 [Bacilli bacterium]|nr:50S ribosomal protein L6 [Bacilli bacterium]
MSRIGLRKIVIPAGVTVTNENSVVTVKGPKGELSLQLVKNINIEINENEISVTRANEELKTKAMHGTTNANLSNLIVGVTEGYSKGLEIIGVGYRFTLKGDVLVIAAGYSHPVELEIPTGLTVESISNTEIIVKGIDKVLVGEFAANIRKVRKPEPYKGKGIRYKNEVVRRKEGKKAA